MDIGFIFPGQGSQFVGMGKDFYNEFEEMREAYDRANEILGFDLKDLCFFGPEDELRKTYNTQPAILAMSVGLAKILTGKGIEPHIVAGHSLGEYSALVIAGVIKFEDALLLVRKRGEFMQEASPLGLGSMYAIIGLSPDKVEEICVQARKKGIVEPANFNSHKQVVISGEIEALKVAGELAKEHGARKVVPLNVSAPFHSSLMKDVEEKMKKEIEKITINDARIPVVVNYSAKAFTKKEDITDALIKQIAHPVLWLDSIKTITKYTTFMLEVGPGKVLRGLMRDIDRNIKVLDTGKVQAFKKTMEELKNVR